MLEIDHVIMTVADVERSADVLAERTGLQALPGGRHPGHGTANRIVPLGGSYLELMYVDNPSEAEDSELGRWVERNARYGDRLSALCLRVDDIEAVATRISHDIEPMSRESDDGSTLEWRLCGLPSAMSDDRLPFFIQWDVPPEQHPGRMTADHSCDCDGIAWVEYGGDHDQLGQWIGGQAAPVRMVGGQPGPRRLAITTSDGPVVVGANGVR